MVKTYKVVLFLLFSLIFLLTSCISGDLEISQDPEFKPLSKTEPKSTLKDSPEAVVLEPVSEPIVEPVIKPIVKVIPELETTQQLIVVAEVVQEETCPVYASKNSQFYHLKSVRSSCPKIKSYNLQCFSSVEEALASGKIREATRC